jgi:hypothetical protein
MKLVRILSFLMVILIAGYISAQTAKTVNAKVLNNTPDQSDPAGCGKYMQLADKLMQGGDTVVSEIASDRPDVHCLLEGTIITMADRKKVAIEKIKQGDKVLVWDPVKKRTDRQEVVKIHTARHPAEDMISIHYRLNKKQTLSLTADHPVYSLTGWLSANPPATKNYKRYADARVDRLDTDAILYRISENGKRLIKKKIDAIGSFKGAIGSTMADTYTLELEGNGIFFANGFAVGQE